MKILEIKNVTRKDVPIYYRRLYSGVAVIELINNQQEYPVDVSIEHKPTGEKEILVTFTNPPDYPLVPLVKEIKKFIDIMDLKGGFPV
ncbi:hypothetical protein AGMMS49928_04140 [Spirochaetia bacterium]|nr:hypothetical protein AGMMS49928_04140 [Spirochaetia bacterium]